MFENCGGKLRGIAKATFVLTAIGAGLTLIMGVISGGAAGFVTGLISGGVTLLAGWISAVNLIAVADAAEYSEQAAENVAEILHLMKKTQGIPSVPYAAPQRSAAPAYDAAAQPTEPPTGGFDGNRVPAWKRVQQGQENKQ